MAVYDTYKPFVIGNQFAPLVENETILDTGSEVGYKFVATEASGAPNSGGTWVWAVTEAPPPGLPNRSEIVCRLYDSAALTSYVPLKKVRIICTAATGGAIGGGAATRYEAVQNPTDGKYIRLTGASQTARLWFDTHTAGIGSLFNVWSTEIVDVSVVYSVSGPFATATTNTMSLGMERQTGPVKRYMDYLVTGPAASSSITEIKRSRFGELCPFWSDAVNPNTSYIRGPWVYKGVHDVGLYALSSHGTDNVAVFFETGASAAGDFDIQYVALDVTYRENSELLGVGGFDLSGGMDIAEGLYAYRCPIMPADTPWNFGGGGITLFNLIEGRSYIITMSRAYSGSVSVSSPVSLPMTMLNTISPTVPGLTGVRVTKPIAIGAMPVYEETTSYPSIVLFDITPTAWATDLIPANVNPCCHTYEQQTPQQIHDSGYFFAEQVIPDDTAATFSWVTFYARASESVDGALYLSQTDGAVTFLGPEATISYDDFMLLPEIVDGWRKVTIPIVPPAVLAGTGGDTYWQFWSSSDLLRIWEVLGATANHTLKATGTSSGAVGTYYGEAAQCYDVTGTYNYPLDMTITLSQDMSPVSTFAVSQQSR